MNDYTYRMLGREHAADLEREAAQRRLADEARGRARVSRFTLMSELLIRSVAGLRRVTSRTLPGFPAEPTSTDRAS
jgi:hypothetical protein